jgi:hypothetical protein
MKLTPVAVRVSTSFPHSLLVEVGNAFYRKIHTTFPHLKIGYCRYEESDGEVQLFAAGDQVFAKSVSEWLSSQGVKNRITQWHGPSTPYNPRSKSVYRPALFKIHTDDFPALIKFLDIDPNVPSWKHRPEYRTFSEAHPQHNFGINPRAKSKGDTKERIQHGYDLLRHFHFRLTRDDALGWNHPDDGTLRWQWYLTSPEGFEHGVDIDISWDDLSAEVSGNPEGDWPGGIGFYIRARQGAKRKSWEYQLSVDAPLERAESLALHAANTIKETFGLTKS